jgi:hypothetical protein
VSRVRSTRAPVDVIMDLELTLTLRKWTRRAMSIDVYPTREHFFTALMEVLLVPDTNCDFVKTLDLSKKRISIIMEQDSCCSDHVVAYIRNAGVPAYQSVETKSPVHDGPPGPPTGC